MTVDAKKVASVFVRFKVFSLIDDFRMYYINKFCLNKHNLYNISFNFIVPIRSHSNTASPTESGVDDNLRIFKVFLIHC